MDQDLLGHSLKPSQATAILGASGMGNNVGTLTGSLPPLHLMPANASSMTLTLVPSFSSSSDDVDEEEEADDGNAHSGGESDLQGSSSSKGEEWGTIHGGNFHTSLSYSSSDKQLPKSFELFVPNSKFQLSSLQTKPLLPYLSREVLPAGSSVWVVDEDDVKTILGINWDRIYRTVCNGRQRGTVRRHSGELTLVEFSGSGANMVYTLSMPRCCLSLTRIEPYDSAPQSDCNIMSSGYGALGPRSNARCGISKTSGAGSAASRARGLQQSFYESPSLFKMSSDCTNAELVAAHAIFLQGNVKAAAEKVEACRATLTSRQDRADFFMLRSRLRVFQGRGQDALHDAEECCRLDPQWIRGYLCAARAHSYLGDFKAADQMIHKASVMVPNSAALQTVESLNRFMLGVSRTVHTESEGTLAIRLDEHYRKKLVVRRDVGPYTPLWSEDANIASTLSLCDTPCSTLCGICFSPIVDASLHASTSITTSPIADATLTSSGGGFCSDVCLQRASLLALEAKHIAGIETARTLLRNKAASTVNPLPLELANLSMRLFFIVMCMHRRLQAQARHSHAGSRPCSGAFDPLEMPVGRSSAGDDVTVQPSSTRQISLDAVLERFNVYPLVSVLESTRRDRGVLALLYDAFSAEFEEEEKRTFDLEFFERLYDYVCTYFVNVQLPRGVPGRPVHVFFVGSIVTAVSRFERPSFKYNVSAEGEDAIPDKVGQGEEVSVQLWHASEEGAKEEVLVPNCTVVHRSQATESPGAPPRLQGVHHARPAVLSRVLQLVATAAAGVGDDLCLPPFEVDLT